MENFWIVMLLEASTWRTDPYYAGKVKLRDRQEGKEGALPYRLLTLLMTRESQLVSADLSRLI